MENYLKLLSKEYRNIQEVSEEIINLQAILNLPKGTELFLSDLHGEYEQFDHILNNGSGIIKNKIEKIFKDSLLEGERKLLATLIYYPEEKLSLLKKENNDMKEWYKITLRRLIEVTKEVSSKYTRSKVRKAIPEGFDYIIDELLHYQSKEKDKEQYYDQIINTIIDLDRTDAFIIAISDLIKRMAIDHLHIIGDIYDRGSNPKAIMDRLMEFHSLDIQWGNHDILWMGAGSGNEACIANVLRIASRYDNLNILEEQYGINIRPLSIFAIETYQKDKCTKFIPKSYEYNKYAHTDANVVAKIHKAISIIQFKLEGKLIKDHPEYEMDNRLLLDKIDYKKGISYVDGKKYKLNDTYFPTIDPENPYELSDNEQEIIDRLKDSFINSEILNKHVSFLYSKGTMYKTFNSNLLFHGCIPLNEDGSFSDVKFVGKTLAGRKYLDYAEKVANKAYFEKENKECKDAMWYLWCSPNSPVFGKDKAATFERYFIDDKEPHKEIKNPYFTLIETEEMCNKILKEFGLDKSKSHIINGHMPVKLKDGEEPIRANGKLLVIDGGFSKSYRKQTGIAGYTLTYNSNGLLLSANDPFDSKQDAILKGTDINYEIMVNEKVEKRELVIDTDIGKRLQEEIKELKLLLNAYKEGQIKENI